MRQGTTPTLILTIRDFETLDGQHMTVDIKQKNTLLHFEHDELEVVENKIAVRLTQAQTLSLDTDRAKVQVRGINSDGVAWASNTVSIDVAGLLNKVEIKYE